MKRLFILSLALVLLAAAQPAGAQTRLNKLLHQGNRAFNKQDYSGAQLYYLQAQKEMPASSRTQFNLANTYLAQSNPDEALKLFEQAAKNEPNKLVRSMAHHNTGYIYQSAANQNPDKKQQLLRQAIDAYKQALRLDPTADETRYNLALCQRQLKDEEQNQNQKQQQQQQQQQQQEQKPKNQQQKSKPEQQSQQPQQTDPQT